MEGVNSLRRNGRLGSKGSKCVNYAGGNTTRSVVSEIPSFEEGWLKSFSRAFVGLWCVGEGQLCSWGLFLNYSDAAFKIWLTVIPDCGFALESPEELLKNTNTWAVPPEMYFQSHTELRSNLGGGILTTLRS